MEKEKLVSFTSTYRTPTAEECREKILHYAKVYAGLKWYESKGYYLRKMKEWANRLKIIEPL